MNLNEIKDLMAQFDQSSLKEFSYKNGTDELVFSKNEAKLVAETSPAPQPVVQQLHLQLHHKLQLHQL